MAKRFTDTDKWNDPWYRKLSPLYKAVWQFICDRCDNAGFWKKDYDAMSFHVGTEIDPDAMMQAMKNGKDRLIDHGEYIQIPDFVQFQYGVLTPDCHPHRKIIELQRLYTAKGLLKGNGKGNNTLTVRVQEEDIEEDIEEEGIKEKRSITAQTFTAGSEHSTHAFDVLSAFNGLLAMFPTKIGESSARRMFFQWEVTAEMVTRIEKSITNYKKHLEANSEWKRPMNFGRFLNEWTDWENFEEPMTEDQKHEALKARLKTR